MVIENELHMFCNSIYKHRFYKFNLYLIMLIFVFLNNKFEQNHTTAIQSSPSTTSLTMLLTINTNKIKTKYILYIHVLNMYIFLVR